MQKGGVYGCVYESVCTKGGGGEKGRERVRG